MKSCLFCQLLGSFSPSLPYFKINGICLVLPILVILKLFVCKLNLINFISHINDFTLVSKNGGIFKQ